MQQRISVLIGAENKCVGTLVFDDTRPDASQFCYADSWCSDATAFAVSPELALTVQWQYFSSHSRKSPFPFAFADTEPESWGRRLLKAVFSKAGHERSLSAVDFLLAADDGSRVGALRFVPEGARLADADAGKALTHPLKDLGQVARAAKRFETGQATDDDLDLLNGIGTSLGGARPKCTVLNENGRLAIGKFASVNDERSVVKGEILGLELARAAGLNAAIGKVVTIDDVNVAVIDRFDRTSAGRRIPYWSMATFLQSTEDGYPPPCYTELNERLYLQADSPDKTTAKEIVGRLLLNYLINNTDDHGRNTGLLMRNNGVWVLSPAFDINPVPLSRPEAPYVSKNYLSLAEGEIEDVRQIWDNLAAFDLTDEEGVEIFKRVIGAVRNWKSLAVKPTVRMNASDLRDYAPAFSSVRVRKAVELAARFEK